MLSHNKTILQGNRGIQQGSQYLRCAGGRSNRSKCIAGLGDAFKDLFDFEKWAPRSSQAWRFGQEPVKNRNATPSKISEDDVDILNKRLRQAQQENPYSSAIEYTGIDRDTKPDTSLPSFTESSDEEFASALNARLSSYGSDNNTSEERLNGGLLLDYIYQKYGKKHDVSFVKRDIPGKTIVSFNIYHAYLGQRSFPMSESDFIDKMDGVAYYLEAWGQSKRVVDFLKEPVAPRRGLPSRPIVGNAVTLQLDLTKDQISEWFGT